MPKTKDKDSSARITGPGTTSYTLPVGPASEAHQAAILAAMSGASGPTEKGVGQIINLGEAMASPPNTKVRKKVKRQREVRQQQTERRQEESRPLTVEDLAKVLNEFERRREPKKQRLRDPDRNKRYEKVEINREAVEDEEPPFVSGKKRPSVPSDDAVYTKDQAVQAIKQGFATLGIPNLGPEATKPKFRVQFDLGPAGKQEAWYHWVGEHDGGLFLVYDTRFEYGMRYSPPNTGLDKPIRVRLPDQKRDYTVYSMDFTHPFGVFAITNLIIAEKEPDRIGGPPTLADIDMGVEDGEEWGN